jgi:3-hydroxyisobutyrate dehydrogenase-like beta-hydroxyacid dehydrogenase
VWDRRADRTEELAKAGAKPARALADLWRTAHVVMTFLSDDEAVTQVCLGPGGLVETAPVGAVLVEMSTISPTASEVVASAALGRGLRYLRCPVSGNPAVLASGNVTLIVSGEREALEEVRPLLEHVSSKIYHVGEAEQARVMKLAINAMLAANAQMLAEVITLCEASGMDRATVLDVVSASAVGSPFVKYKADALVGRQYDATFTTCMLVKDLRLAQGVATTLSVPLPVTDLVAGLAVATCEEGLGDLDFLALLPHLQAKAGRPSDVPVPLASQGRQSDRSGAPPGHPGA